MILGFIRFARTTLLIAALGLAAAGVGCDDQATDSCPSGQHKCGDKACCKEGYLCCEGYGTCCPQTYPWLAADGCYASKPCDGCPICSG